MTDVDARRMHLLSVIRDTDMTVNTGAALRIYAESPVGGIGRTAVRRDLRDLAHRGYLIPNDGPGPRTYTVAGAPPAMHPFLKRGRSLRAELLDVVQREGGEWTVGRARTVCRQLMGTHVYRARVRRLLADLHWRGHLVRHGDGTPRRYYTATTTTREDGAV